MRYGPFCYRCFYLEDWQIGVPGCLKGCHFCMALCVWKRLQDQYQKRAWKENFAI